MYKIYTGEILYVHLIFFFNDKFSHLKNFQLKFQRFLHTCNNFRTYNHVIHEVNFT